MKYAYNGISKSEIIEKYVIEGNKLIIYYLDGSKTENEYSKELEEEVIEKMLNQALEFVISSDLKAKTKANIIINWPGLPIIISTIFGHTDPKATRSVLITCVVGLTLKVISSIFKINSELEKGESRVESIEKYRSFLAVQKSLRQYQNDVCLLNGVCDRGSLSINTLDDYSLKEVEQISKNIDLCIKKENLYMEIISYIYKYINNPKIFKNVVDENVEVKPDNLDTIIEGLSLEKVKKLKQNISDVAGYDI